MKVWSFGEHSAPLDLVTLETDNRIMNKLIDTRIGPVFNFMLVDFFADRNYGVGVKEIFYYERCLMPKDNYKVPELYKYSKRLKKINAFVELDYDTVLELDVPQLAQYIALKYIERSEDFFKLEVKEFNCEMYIGDLKKYLSDLM